jgi:ABC-type dipeptide/oligopeptide/nickel transport system permease component
MKFTYCNVDQVVFFKWESIGALIVVAVHIDDYTVVMSTMKLMDAFKNGI